MRPGKDFRQNYHSSACDVCGMCTLSSIYIYFLTYFALTLPYFASRCVLHSRSVCIFLSMGVIHTLGNHHLLWQHAFGGWKR